MWLARIWLPRVPGVSGAPVVAPTRAADNRAGL